MQNCARASSVEDLNITPHTPLALPPSPLFPLPFKKYLQSSFLCFGEKMAKVALSMIYLIKVFYQENTTETGLFLYSQAPESSKFTYTKDRHPPLSLECLPPSPTLLVRSFVTKLGKEQRGQAWLCRPGQGMPLPLKTHPLLSLPLSLENEVSQNPSCVLSISFQCVPIYQNSANRCEPINSEQKRTSLTVDPLKAAIIYPSLNFS